MIVSAGDLSVEIDFGLHKSGAILQREEFDVWVDFLISGQKVTMPIDMKLLPPGRYRLHGENKVR